MAVVNPASDELRQPTSLQLFSANGELIHRMDISTFEDDVILACLLKELDSQEAACKTRSLKKNIIPFPSNYTSHISVSDKFIKNNLDDILFDGGRLRNIKLKSQDKQTARKINPKVIGHFLFFLSVHRIPFTRIIARPSLLQSNNGPVYNIDAHDGLVVLHADRSLMAIDISAIHECWAVRYKKENQTFEALELYDKKGHAIAVLLPEINGNNLLIIEWERLVKTLPA